ncbi:hypothetical protein PCYB_122380 [Plasmodium cynomolgi strain B]|uniref:Uncharacterized protein n=1 Tax=Plasmodium cynomolgi (strain B) TaxID=1120755 RepID=K6UE37_PLACD|nr:hypothetical protein PCYB_122380 [Plasmodium cynomolgi strain B]GAB67671.1 hypothetical protein PCYB_122380 [Plasmodium cynomolgi strain B]
MNISKIFFSKVGEVIKNGNSGMNMQQGASQLYSGKKLIYISKPTHGGFIYWKCRELIHTVKKKTKRCARYLDINHDFSRAALVGVPKTSYDPKNNIFYIQMDNEEWAGNFDINGSACVLAWGAIFLVKKLAKWENILYVRVELLHLDGIGSKMMLNISMNILFYLHISFWIYFIYYRMLVNNKHNVFSKWKTDD